MVRLVTGWQTKVEEVDRFAAVLSGVSKDPSSSS